MSKVQLRKNIRQIMRGYSPRQREELSFPVVWRILTHPRVISADTIILFHSLPDEVNTHSLISTLRSRGKRILLPKVISPTEMTLHEYSGEESLAPGKYGIMEPITPEASAQPPVHKSINMDITGSPTVAIVPGVAFDKHGNRLGRGKGYYDRLLVGAHIYKIGVCFPFQLLDNIPHDEHDIRMDEIISQ